MKHTLAKLLMEHLDAKKVSITDNSHKHAHHKGTPHTQHTHFDVNVVSNQFENLSKVKRHQMVYALAKPLFSTTLHALSMTLKTTKEDETT